MIFYVNAKAARQGDGSKERPFKHINDAAKVAREFTASTWIR